MFEEGAIFNELLLERLNYFIYVVLLLIGLYAMISKNNLIKKLIGMSIFQTAIILFYVSLGVKEGATVPIYKAEHDPHGHAASHDANDTEVDAAVVHSPQALEQGQVAQYANPLPHVLMLTAIVVGVATLGLALALTQRIFQGYGTVEEDELLVKLEREDARKSVSPLKAKVSTPKKTKTTKAKERTSPKKSDKPKPKASKTTSKRTSSPKKKS